MSNLKKRILTLGLVLALMFSLAAVPGMAADSVSAEDAANELYALGLFQGTAVDSEGLPLFSLDRAPTRHEAVTMLVRLLGKEQEALAGSWDIPFGDVADWAVPYVGYAYAHGLTDGTSVSTYSGQNPVTAAQYITFVLRAMCYSSGEDFDWERSVELSDRLGITDGEYSEGGAAFLRGDVALISLAALSARCSDGSLLGSELAGVGSTMTKDDYLADSLSQSEFAALRDASAQELRDRLSTLGDVLTWLDSWNAEMYTSINLSGDMRLDFSLDWLRDGISASENYTALAAYFLSDNYPGMRCVMADVVSREGGRWLLTALALPVKEGYLIISPVMLSNNLYNANCRPASFEEVVVPSLTDLNEYLVAGPVAPGELLQHIFVADCGQTDLHFTLTDTDCVLSGGQARLVFSMSQAEVDDYEEAERLAFADQSWSQLTENWASLGITQELMPTLSRAEAAALYGKDIDTVAAAVKTLGDCIYYYAAAGTRAEGVDIVTFDKECDWHYNYAPAAVLAHNFFNCGASAGLTARLLEGDYDEVGLIGMTFAAGEGGGHVINYLRAGDRYYVFDIVNLVSTGYTREGFLLTGGDSLSAAALGWSGSSPWNEKLMHAYVSFDGDAPVGWNSSNVSYLSTEYYDSARILLQTPDEGYVYEWRDISPAIRADIDSMRGAA